METTTPDLAAGMALARELVRRTGVTDPETLRSVARTVRSLASSELEEGAARGFEALAREIEEATP